MQRARLPPRGESTTNRYRPASVWPSAYKLTPCHWMLTPSTPDRPERNYLFDLVWAYSMPGDVLDVSIRSEDLDDFHSELFREHNRTAHALSMHSCTWRAARNGASEAAPRFLRILRQLRPSLPLGPGIACAGGVAGARLSGRGARLVSQGGNPHARRHGRRLPEPRQGP